MAARNRGRFVATSVGLWREENQAPVFPERMNRWILQTSLGDSSGEIAANLEAAVVRNAGRSVVRAFRVVELAVDPSQIEDDTEVLEGVSGLPVGPTPQDPEGSVAALVEFAWDSPRESVPWLSERLALGLLPRDTFSDPDTLLIAVLEPGGSAPAPEPGLFEDIQDALESPALKVGAIAGVGLAAVALILLTGDD